MNTATTGGPQTPAEVLIPEARHHQRQRYARVGITVFLAAVLLAGLTAIVVVLVGGDAGGKTQANPPVPVRGHGAAPVYFRPVLCAAPAYSPAATAPAGPPACSAGTALTTQNLKVQPAGSAPAGFSSNNVPLDTALAGAPSTGVAADKASATVLLPALPQTGVARYVLGPAQMTTASIGSATAKDLRPVGWVVDYTMTPRGAPLWDRVARENFHRYVAIDLGGVVYSAPIIQPTQSSFSSFGGKGEIGGNLTKAEAVRLAAAMRSQRG